MKNGGPFAGGMRINDFILLGLNGKGKAQCIEKKQLSRKWPISKCFVEFNFAKINLRKCLSLKICG